MFPQSWRLYFLGSSYFYDLCPSVPSFRGGIWDVLTFVFAKWEEARSTSLHISMSWGHNDRNTAILQVKNQDCQDVTDKTRSIAR